MDGGLVPVLDKFFPERTSEEGELLERVLVMRQVEAGEMLFAAGQTNDCLYLVIEGRFAVHRPIGLGDRSQVVALLERGTVIGESMITDARSHLSTVSAVAPSVVMCFSREALTTIEMAAPRLFLRFMKKVMAISSLRLQKSSDRLAQVL